MGRGVAGAANRAGRHLKTVDNSGNVPECSVSVRPAAPVAGWAGLWPNTLTAEGKRLFAGQAVQFLGERRGRGLKIATPENAILVLNNRSFSKGLRDLGIDP